MDEIGAGYIVARDAGSFVLVIRKYINLDQNEKKKMSNAAIELAKYKVEQSKVETGYRKIFG